MCIGSKDNAHGSEVYEPTDEDVIYCLCDANAHKNKNLKRDCLQCSMKCRKCTIMRKDMIVFGYIPLHQQLSLLTKSHSLCLDLLTMWHNKKRWLGKQQNEQLEYVNEFWDGTKCREYQQFWDPNSAYELPIICKQSHCKKAYRAFPNSQVSQSLRDCWKDEEEGYEFSCKRCHSQIRCKRQIQYVSSSFIEINFILKYFFHVDYVLI